MIATILAAPAYRHQVTDDSVFDLDERPADSPMALRTWFCPGENTGQEFVYHYQYTPEPQYASRNDQR